MSVIKMATYRMQQLDAVLFWLCFLGVGVSYYAYYVESNMERDGDYQPFCDLSEHVSCSKAFMSEYGKGFGLIPNDSPFHLPNSVFGIIFYTLIACLSLFNHYWNTLLLLVFSINSNMFSLYLAVILYQLRTICAVCVCTYILNLFIMILTIRKLREIKQVQAKKRKTK